LKIKRRSSRAGRNKKTVSGRSGMPIRRRRKIRTGKGKLRSRTPVRRRGLRRRRTGGGGGGSSYQAGFNQAYSEGYNMGFAQGFEDGHKLAYEQQV